MRHWRPWVSLLSGTTFVLLVIWAVAAWPLWPRRIPILTPGEIARRIGAVYGDPRARVVWVQSDQTEGPPFHPMYLIRVSGHFHDGRLRASSLSFSATADHLYTWGIRATAQSRVVWTEDEWPVSFDQAQLTPVP